MSRTPSYTHHRPNILFLVSEDCPPRLGAYGDPFARTPNIDALAAAGTVYTQAFSSFPVCAPSRFGLLTGVHAVSNGPAHHMASAGPRPAWMRGYSEILGDLGYYRTNNYKTAYNTDIRAADIWDESSPQAHWRNSPDGTPFLATFNILVTHESYVFDAKPPSLDPRAVSVPAYLPDVPEVRQDIARYYDGIAQMDAEVGRLLTELEEDGLAEDTIVVYTSDHGGVNPRSKYYCYDEGLHVPLVVKAPKKFAHLFPEPGTRIDVPVSTVSIPATIIDVAGAPVPCYMQEPSLARREHHATDLAFSSRGRMDERTDIMRTVRSRQYRLIRNFTPHRPYAQHHAYAWTASAYRAWEQMHLDGRLAGAPARFFAPTKPAVELYDLTRDPDEVDNLADSSEHAAIRAHLEAELRSWMIARWDNGFMPEGDPEEGYEPSRAVGAYPLPEVLDVAYAAVERSDANVEKFVQTLASPVPAARYWAAQGLLMLTGLPPITLDAASRSAFDDTERSSIRIPLLELLAREMSDRDAVQALVEFAARGTEAEALTALNALTYLDPALVQPHTEVLAVVADHDHEYIRGAARYLMFVLAGTYQPDSPVFAWDRVDFSYAQE